MLSVFVQFLMQFCWFFIDHFLYFFDLAPVIDPLEAGLHVPIGFSERVHKFIVSDIDEAEAPLDVVFVAIVRLFILHLLNIFPQLRVIYPLMFVINSALCLILTKIYLVRMGIIVGSL